jgi:four helix bundle protein
MGTLRDGTCRARRAAGALTEDLLVWQRAIDLAVDRYRITEKFPRSERYGLTGQIRRAAVSIPSNVAEGHWRRTTRAYMNHVSTSLGSSDELDTDLVLAERLNFLWQENSARLAAADDQIGRMLHGLFKALDMKIRAGEER